MSLSNDIRIVTQSDHIEGLLARYRETIADDFEGYRGHIYRVLSYALHFLGDEETDRPTIEAALVYHDIGLWSDRALGYLEPSIARAQQDNATEGWGYDAELLHDIIYWHHKVTPFRGRNADVVNAVRRADWVDASAGLVRMGMPKPCVAEVRRTIGDAGFYDTLKRIGPELTGSLFKSIPGLLQVYKI
ncbi:MAG: phosphohydrolase [Myxococcota bacterium]